MHQTHIKDSLPTSRQARALAVLLCASAVVLTLLILVQTASWLDAQPEIRGLTSRAHASGMVAASGDLVVLSGEIGDQDLLLHVDNRNESISAYGLDNNNQPQLLQQLSIPRVFREAQARGAGRR
ncbi:MAG TPA: hypothetical protein VK176_16400 [Phycisphaerales bacterium]|nr:hypothetical protein [Phycisphaerales bacterium]